MIEINKLQYSYSKRGKPLLKELSCSLEAGKIYGLLGKNGMGKTSFLQLLLGLLKPGKGRIQVEQIDCYKRSPKILSQFFYVPEEFVFPNVSLKSYTKSLSSFYPSFQEKALYEYLAIFQLSPRINISKLSMGEKKKVQISLALASGCKYLLMDEPTNGLDIPSKAQLRKAIQLGMNEEKIILISTHQVRDIDSLLDHILLLHQGELIINHSIEHLSQKFVCKECGLYETSPDLIYEQASLGGKTALFLAKEPSCNPLNLEVLFNASIDKTLAIQQFLNT